MKNKTLQLFSITALMWSLCTGHANAFFHADGEEGGNPDNPENKEAKIIPPPEVTKIKTGLEKFIKGLDVPNALLLGKVLEFSKPEDLDKFMKEAFKDIIPEKLQDIKSEEDKKKFKNALDNGIDAENIKKFLGAIQDPKAKAEALKDVQKIVADKLKEKDRPVAADPKPSASPGAKPSPGASPKPGESPKPSGQPNPSSSPKAEPKPSGSPGPSARERDLERALQEAALQNALGQKALNDAKNGDKNKGGGDKGGDSGSKSNAPNQSQNNNDDNHKEPSGLDKALEKALNNKKESPSLSDLRNSFGDQNRGAKEDEKKKEDPFKTSSKPSVNKNLLNKNKELDTESSNPTSAAQTFDPSQGGTLGQKPKNPVLSGKTDIPGAIPDQYAATSSASIGGSLFGGGDEGGGGGGFNAPINGAGGGLNANKAGDPGGFGSVGQMEPYTMDPPIKKFLQEVQSVGASSEGEGEGEGGSSSNEASDYTSKNAVKRGDGLFVNQILLTNNNPRAKGRGIMAYVGAVKDFCQGAQGKQMALCSLKKGDLSQRE